jgi:hypothetical protein
MTDSIYVIQMDKYTCNHCGFVQYNIPLSCAKSVICNKCHLRIDRLSIENKKPNEVLSVTNG